MTLRGKLGVAVSGNYAYVADDESGLRVIDITNPSSPFEAGYYDTPGYASGVAVAGNYAYVADGYSFGIYDCSAATGISENFILHPSSFVLSSYPNPFNATTSLMYRLGYTCPVMFSIFDVTGREVTTLVQSVQPAGEHRAVWNAHGFSSGTYFARLQAGKFSQTAKIVLMK